MSKLLYSLALTFACSPAFAGPSTPAMVESSSPVPANTEAAVTAVVSEGSPDRLDYRTASIADAADIGPADPHPMIPIPPAVWAGFVGLAYVARRVTSRRA